MTGIYFFARRDGERIPVEIDQMTNDELDLLLARSQPESLPGIVKALATWIRDEAKVAGFGEQTGKVADDERA